VDAIAPRAIALCPASEAGKTEEVQALLQGGADPSLANAEGEEPLQLAMQNKHWEVAAALIRGGADLTTTLDRAAERLRSEQDREAALAELRAALFDLEAAPEDVRARAGDAFVATEVFGHLMPLLCHPEAAARASAAQLVAAVCKMPKCTAAMLANDALPKRLAYLFLSEKGAVQVHAATALGLAAPAPHADARAFREVTGFGDESAEAVGLLAVLTGSQDKQLRQLAERLFRAVASTKDIEDRSQLRKRGLDSMLGKPYPSAEFRKYQERGWEEPKDELRHCLGESLKGKTVFVEGEGEGTIMDFKRSKMGAEKHEIEFVLMGLKKIALKRQGKNGTDWLVPPKEPLSLANTWKRNGGRAATTKMYTRGASKDDVCLWMWEQTASICHHYAGLFAWMLELDPSLEAAGTVLLNMATDNNHGHTRLFVTHVTIVAHREQLVGVIAGLAGFLGRYLLLPGPSIHTSATCVLILAEDRQQENADGTLKKVALKCMKNIAQFLTELQMREGLDAGKVVNAIRVHAPPSFADPNVLTLSDKPAVITPHVDSPDSADMELEPQPEADVEPELDDMDPYGTAETRPATTHKFTLFGVELLVEPALEQDARYLDGRLAGQYVIVMDCADCDLGSDISHGHYAGRDKRRVQQLLKKIICCFLYCEEHKLVHGDIK
jgi:hypothetical protein